MKGRISTKVENILHDGEGRKQLRNTLISGRDCRIVVGGKNYRVSSKNVATRSCVTGRFVSKKSGGSLKSSASVKSKTK